MSRKILYLSYFFEPDLGAGSFRNTALAEKMASLMHDHDEIDLLTTMPNRYANINQAASPVEQRGRLAITRFAVSRGSDSFIQQIRSFRQYRRQVLQHVGNRSYDLVFASSSKLFTAYLAMQIARSRNIPLYVDLRDLFAENMKELIPFMGIGHVLSGLIRHFYEKPCLQYAAHLNINSEGFCEEFKYRGNLPMTFFPNGIDDFFLGHTQSAELGAEPVVITYAGNIGEGQGLHKVIPAMAKGLGSCFRIQVIGSGSSLHKLKSVVAQNKLDNVRLIAPVARKELIAYYRHSHYLFLHLNDYRAFEKVIPSKLFEYGALNMPVIAGVAGYPARFIREQLKANFILFAPCDAASAVQQILAYPYHLETRTDFVDKYQREHITAALAQSVLSYLDPQP
ncbi:MAG: glycosyltransferase family 4 protein [Saprospiraceae bacterium]